MKVTLVTRSTLGHGLGGMERYIDDQMSALKELGLRLTLVTSPGMSARYRARLSALDVDLVTVDGTNWRHYDSRWHQVAPRIVRSVGHEAIIFHGLAGIAYRPQSGEQVFTLTHGSAPLSLHNSALGGRPIRSIAGRARTILTKGELLTLRKHNLVALSKYDARLTGLSTFQRASGIAVIPPVIASPDASRSSNGERLPILLVAGRVERSKGIVDFLRSWASIDRRGHRLVIAGDGTLLPELTRYAPADVTFMGRLEPSELSQLMTEARWTLGGGRYLESFGLSAAESLASGTPVIFRRRGALPETVGRAGLSFITVRELERVLQSAVSMGEAAWTELSAASSRRASEFSAARYAELWGRALGVSPNLQEN